MTTEEKLKLLAEWQASHDQIEEKLNELGKLFKDITGPLFDAAWRTFSNYTKLVSAQLGDECADSEEQVVNWLLTADRVCSAPSCGWCTDCLPEFQARMIDQGRCENPNVVFPRNEGVIEGVIHG